jgi:hypothetical protein
MEVTFTLQTPIHVISPSLIWTSTPCCYINLCIDADGRSSFSSSSVLRLDTHDTASIESKSMDLSLAIL